MGTTKAGAQRLFSTIRGMSLTAGIGLSLLLMLASSASALSGNTIDIGEFAHNGPPSIAVDEAGNALIAWADEAGPPYKIHYCALPVGATACAHSGTLIPAGGAEPYIDGVKVLVDKGTFVVLADVYGVGQEYEPEQEWTSTDGGASFTATNGGTSVVEAKLSADTVPTGAVVVPGTGVLGYAWVTAAGPPTFGGFPLSSPPQCSVKAGHTCPFATLQSESSEHLLSNEPGAVASQSGASPGVLGVYETLGKPGCSSGTFDSAFVYGSGNQSASNSYSISPGEPNSAWRVPLSPGDCEVEYPTVGGGPSGFGVVEDDLTRGFTVYHRFDQATDAFDAPYTTVAQEGEQSASLSQDGLGDVYTTYLARFGEVRLAYSPDGGTTWAGPATLNAVGGGDLTSNVNVHGQGWATWISGETVYAQPFVAADAVGAPAPDSIATVQSWGTTSGTSLSVPAGTIGETDRATIAGVNAATAIGTVTYSLYSSPSCTLASKVYSGGTATVVAGVAGPSSPVTSALAAGSYYWQAAYSGNEGNLLGVRGNAANVSACGAEVLTIGAAAPPAPTSNYTVKSIAFNINGTVTIVFVPVQSGEAELVVTVPTASLASSSAVAAKAKKCKKGQVKIKGKCRPAKTVAGKASGHGTAGSTLKLTVHLSSKIKALLKKGKTVHLSAKLTYKSVLGGAPTVRYYNLTVKGHKLR